MVVENEPPARQALQDLLNDSPEFHCTGAHETAEAALDSMDAERPRVVLVDLGLPGMSGVEFLRLCRSRHPDVLPVVVTVHDNPGFVFPALEAGAVGYVVKGAPPARLLDAIREVAAGGSWMSGSIARMVLKSLHGAADHRNDLDSLSQRETEVLQCLARGYTYQESAAHLQVSIRTINSHLQNIYRKLHVHSAPGAVGRLLAASRPPPPPPPAPAS